MSERGDDRNVGNRVALCKNERFARCVDAEINNVISLGRIDSVGGKNDTDISVCGNLHTVKRALSYLLGIVGEIIAGKVYFGIGAVVKLDKIVIGLIGSCEVFRVGGNYLAYLISVGRIAFA